MSREKGSEGYARTFNPASTARQDGTSNTKQSAPIKERWGHLVSKPTGKGSEEGTGRTPKKGSGPVIEGLPAKTAPAKMINKNDKNGKHLEGVKKTIYKEGDDNEGKAGENSPSASGPNQTDNTKPGD